MTLRRLAVLLVAALAASVPAHAIDLLGVFRGTPAHIRRGNEVEKKYQDYTKLLAHAHATLKACLTRDEPALISELNPAPPHPVPYGYQILPALSKEPPPGERVDPPRASSIPYSWPRTAQYIDWQLPRIQEMEEQLKAAEGIAVGERHPVYVRWLKEYRELEANQRLIDVHIQYNRFWQNAIGEDQPHFQRLTKLHDLALERQAVVDALAAKDDATFLRALSTVREPDLDLTRPRAALEPELHALEKKLTTQIHAENSDIEAPPYVKLTHPRPNLWEAHVLLYTDISDRKFQRAAKQAIERIWTVEERENSYRMHVDIVYLAPELLYRGARPPARGAHIDVAAHAARFPRNGGVLTTGSNSTYAIPGEYVALGPQALSQNVLAHEFGHVLGFVDGYFRGFHDLGDKGYEVIEVVPDPTDIMSTPSSGHVQTWEYLALIDAHAKRRARQGVSATARPRAPVQPAPPRQPAPQQR